jgi:hypothetical protein
MELTLEETTYLSLDFFVVRAVTFFGLGLLDFADPWPLRPWSGFLGCCSVSSFLRLGCVPVTFGLLPRSPPWFIFALLYLDVVLPFLCQHVYPHRTESERRLFTYGTTRARAGLAWFPETISRPSGTPGFRKHNVRL